MDEEVVKIVKQKNFLLWEEMLKAADFPPHGGGEMKRRPDGSVGMALVLPALTDCRWWFESLLVHSGVSSATRRKATGADHKKGVGK